MDALLQEIERLEEETKGKTVAEEIAGVETVAEPEAEQEAETEQEAEAVDEVAEPEADEVAPVEEDKALKAQDEYRKRQAQKKEESKRKSEEADAQAEKQKLQAQINKESDVDEAEELRQKLKQVDQIIHEKRVSEFVLRAENELNELEKEFKIAFTDYDDALESALAITKDRMVTGGMSPRQADEALRLEKIKIADAAAARGEDPVEAVYKEANAINSWFDGFAEKRGYTKTAKAKPASLTQKAAMREASKPNAISNGSGASAAKHSFDEMDDISNITFGDMLSGKYK